MILSQIIDEPQNRLLYKGNAFLGINNFIPNELTAVKERSNVK